MTGHAPLTDRAALAQHRRRAERQGAAMFLHDLAADEIEERLDEVNRRFTDIAVVTGHPAFWRHALPHGDGRGGRGHRSPSPRRARSGHSCLRPALGERSRRASWSRRGGPCAPTVCSCALPSAAQTLAELRTALAEAEVALTGGLSPRVLPMGEIRDLGGLLQRAGFALPVADSLTQVVTYASPLSLFRDLRGDGRDERAGAARPAHATAAVRRGDGDLRQRLSRRGWPDPRHVRTGLPHRMGARRKPAEAAASRVGARTRLADALGAVERPAGDPVRPRRD